MKKKKNKGFLLVETLAVTTIVAAILIFLFIQFSRLNNSYTDYYKYNNSEGLYALEDALEYLNGDSTALTNIKNNINTKGYVNLKDCEIFTDKNYCSVLFNSLNIEEIIISSRIASNLTEIDPDIYIKVTNRLISTTNYFLVAKFSDNSYAALDTVLDFREDIEVKFTGFFSTSNYDTTLKQGGTLRIKLSEQPNSLLIQGLNTPNEYIAGTDYTYNRETGILIFKRIPESIEIIAQGIEYCKFYKEKAEKTDLDLSECLVVSNYANYNAYSDELRYETAKEIISVVPEDSKNKPEPYIIYTEYESEKLTAAGNKSVTGSYYDDTIIPVSTTGYNFDITRGVYELKKEDETYKYMSLSEMKEYLNNNNNNKLYSCLSAEVVKCRNLWEIKKIDINDKSKYYISKAIKHTYLVNEDYSNNPGLYKVEDDYTSNNSNYSYIYRGQLENNWVKLGDFLYRIIRINGNGTIRLIYSGKANDESHTEGNAVIKDSSFAPKPNNSDKILGYTASTYVGYKYNPTLKVGQYESTNDSSTLDKYLMNDGISSNSKFYIFKNFNKNTCVVNNGYCELKCDYSCDESDNSCNCINVIWPNYWQDEDLYNTTSSVNAVDKYYTRYQYTGDYKYSCFQFSKVSEENGEVTVTCPVVEEIVGVVSNYPRYAVVKNYGLLSSTNEEDDHYFAKNESNSNVKTVVDEWYKENFTTIDSQTNEEVGTELSNYLSDEIFCNNRTIYDTSSSGTIWFGYRRIAQTSGENPSLSCPSGNDTFTKSNQMLTYPVGLITADEAVYAGFSSSYYSDRNYLFINKSYWTMTPGYARPNLATVYYIQNNGNVNLTGTYTSLGVRPVLNLKADVKFKSGSGIETDPYIIESGGN